MSKYSVVILCGGNSSRMGTDKALLDYNGNNMITNVYNNFKMCDELLISVGFKEKYKEIRGCHIIDDKENCGPLGGILKALSVMKNEWLFVVGCDMPLITKEFADELFEKIDENSQAIVPLGMNKIYCIGAFYNRSVLNKIDTMINNNDFKLLNLLRNINAKYILLDKEKDNMLINLNTRKDYRKLVRKHIPVLCISGYSNSGKTTTCKKIIDYLEKQNIYVAYIKHTHHEIELDNTKDSIRILKNNVKNSIVFNGNSYLKFERINKLSIDELISSIDNVDLILIEGLKDSSIPKIWIKSEEDNDEIKNNVVFEIEKIYDEKQLFEFVLNYIER